jgi:hypothetical protein
MIRLVALHGTSQWDLVAKAMEGRTPRQCRERWKSFLSPGHVNGAWSTAEDRKLIELYRIHGPRWAFIARQFTGRSDYNVKNRWKRFADIGTQQHEEKKESGAPQGRQIPFDPGEVSLLREDELNLDHFASFLWDGIAGQEDDIS